MEQTRNPPQVRANRTRKLPADHRPLSLMFKLILLLCFAVLECKQETLLNAVIRTHWIPKKYLPSQSNTPLVWPYTHFTYFMTFDMENSIVFKSFHNWTLRFFRKLAKEPIPTHSNNLWALFLQTSEFSCTDINCVYLGTTIIFKLVH